MPIQPNGDYSADFIETYVVGNRVPELHQRVVLFLPAPSLHPKPPSGYPVMVVSSHGGFITSLPGTVIPFSNPSILQYRQLAELGCAVAWVGATGSYAGFSTLNTTSPGRGLFHPPGTPQWENDDLYSAQKEAILAVQLIRERAGVWGLDPANIGIEGNSAGSVSLGCCMFWPDQADPTKTDHRRQSSRVKLAILGIFQADFGLYDPAATTPPNFSNLPDSNLDIELDLAPTYADAPAGYMRWWSMLQIGFDTPLQRAAIGSGVYIWQHHFLSGKTITDMTLSGEYGETTGKVATAQGTLDPNALDAIHEYAFGVLMARALREIEYNGWHDKNSRLLFDLSGAGFVAGNSPDAIPWIDAMVEAPAAILEDLYALELAYIRTAFFAPQTQPDLETLAPIIAGEVVDVELAFGIGGADLVVLQGDLGRESGLRTAILVSLFSDARAPDEMESLHDGTDDPRGWWAEDSGDPFGSRLWLQDRSKVTEKTVEEMRSAAETALSWLVLGGLATTVKVSAALVNGDSPRVDLAVEIERSSSSRWSGIWEAEELESFQGSDLRVTFTV